MVLVKSIFPRTLLQQLIFDVFFQHNTKQPQRPTIPPPLTCFSSSNGYYGYEHIFHATDPSVDSSAEPQAQAAMDLEESLDINNADPRKRGYAAGTEEIATNSRSKRSRTDCPCKCLYIDPEKLGSNRIVLRTAFV